MASLAEGRLRRVAGRGWRAGWLSAVAGAVLLLVSGCALLGDPAVADRPVDRPVDPDAPRLIVTLGGAVPPTATQGVAPTIPDSTPLPRIDPPTRDPSAPAPPVASPSLSFGSSSAAARNARPPAPAVPPSSPVPAIRAP